jgi:predicted CXXCH cytochrome family protein
MTKIMKTKTTNPVRMTAGRAIAAGIVLLPCLLLAADDPAVDPHWNKATCSACHADVSPTAESSGLRADSEQLCESCHGDRGDALPCRHSSGIPVGDHPMPDSYRQALKDGLLTCTTCHDLTVQCLSPSRSHSLANPGFIRDRKSRNRGDQCFGCHDASGYEPLDPHALEADNPAQPTCMLCHVSVPLRSGPDWLSVDLNMAGRLNDMCLGCHRVQPHPGNMFSAEPATWNHLTVPSAEILENMKLSGQQLGFAFPLDPSTGEIYCATCHNPHHEDLAGYPVADTPGTEYRLRVDNNCQACHDL